MSDPDTFERSLWSALTPPAAPAEELAGEIRADVAVVGAGLLGLSTALHLAEAGCRVVLLEAQEPGFGASGRSTGFVVPSLRTSLGPAEVRRRLGERGDRLTALVGLSGAAVFALIERHAIACAAERTGWMQPAHTAAMLATLRRRQADWAAFGHRVDILCADETARRVGASGYHGALFDPTGGQLNPLAYARGLADAARRLGVRLHARSPVLRIERDGTGHRLSTPRGQVRAGRVLLTTNALAGALRPALSESIVPVRVQQIATQRLPETIARSVLPDRSPMADTRRHTLAVRWSPDGRLVTGGLVLPGPGSRARAMRGFSRRLERLFPQIGPISAEFAWNGVIAATMDALPRFLSLEPGLDAAIGCNGRGIALTTALGREIAGLYAGTLAPGDFALPHLLPEPVPGRRLARLGPSLWLPWSNLRDRLESRPPANG